MEFGVGSICKVLPVAPSSYYAHLGIWRDPRGASNRARQDVADSAEIRRVHDESRGRYGARKVWHQLRRENKDIARCTVERLMKAMKLQGVVRGKQIITTNPDTSQSCPPLGRFAMQIACRAMVEALNEAIYRFGPPEIMNTDSHMMVTSSRAV